MLPARSVLGEEAREVGAVQAEDCGRPLRGPEGPDAVGRETSAEQRASLRNDLVISGVEKDAQAITSAGADDVSVAQVQRQ